MSLRRLCSTCRNQEGVTFLMTMFIITIMGVMLGLTGQSWKQIMEREREKELLFRGSQIKEAIENWYNPKYRPRDLPLDRVPRPLTDLKDLLQDPYMLATFRYLPHNYAMELDSKNPRCGTDCPKLKVNEDPLTGQNWEVIKCDTSVAGHPLCGKYPGTNTIIGVRSKSEGKPYRMEFKDTALENIANPLAGSTTGVAGTPPPVIDTTGTNPTGGTELGKAKKYSEWKFVADMNNDHTKIYRAYHEGL
jgi:hypothetical protein